MGYDLALSCKDKASYTRLKIFFDNNLQAWSKLAEGTELAVESDYDDSSITQVNERACEFGFHYHSWVPRPVRSYIYALMSWAALRVGKQITFKNILGGPVPYLDYEGSESIPVIQDKDQISDKISEEVYLVDVDGFEPAYRWWLDLPDVADTRTEDEERKADLQDRLIKGEVSRLSALWDKE